MTRLNKYLSECGIASRRSADTMIQNGRVKVNGSVVTEMGVQVQEGKDQIMVDGRSVRPVMKKTYLMLNKPKGFVTTAQDERGRRTVFELFNIRNRVFPVGRLDIKTEGLLIFTNDGELAHRLMHPSFKVNKIYRVRLDRDFDPNDYNVLCNGVELEDGITQPCKAGFYTSSTDRVQIKLREGRKNQVRRMFEALGYEVVALKRVQYGPLSVKDLDRSKWRYLTPHEIKQLKLAAGLSKPKNAR